MPPPLTRRLFLAGGLAACATPGAATAQVYVLVQERSQLTFLFTASGATQEGSVPVETADILVNPGNLAQSSAEVTADIRKVKSPLIFITQAIKSPELLHADAHPIVRFKSTRIRLGARGRISEGARIEGDLTLRGATRPIVLDATLTRPAGTPPDDLSVLNIRLRGALDRNAFGASGYAGMAESRVELDIRAEIRAQG